MAHARHVVDFWDDDEDDLERSFALPSDDPDPLRLRTTAESASAGAFDAAFDHSDDDSAGLPAGLPKELSGRRAQIVWSPRRTSPADEDPDGELDWGGTIRASALGGRPRTLRPSSTSVGGSSRGLRTFTSAHEAGSFAVGKDLRHPNSQQSRTESRRTVGHSVQGNDDDDEADLILPPTLARLALRPLRSQPSVSSFLLGSTSSEAADDWDTSNPAPPSSTCSNAPSLVRDGTGSEAEPSSSDLDFDFLEPEDDEASEKVSGRRERAEDDEDGLDGIVLPDPLLFARTNASAYLRSLLEAKSRGTAITTIGAANGGRGAFDTVRIASGLDSASAFACSSDDSFEADLVLDEDDDTSNKAATTPPLLSAARLKTVQARSLTAARARTLPSAVPGGPRPKPLTTPARSGTLATATAGPSRSATADDELTRELERGWGRPKSPLPPPPPPTQTSSVAKLGKGRPWTQARPPVTAPTLAPQTDSLTHVSATTTPLRRQRSQARLDESSPPSTVSNDPSAVQPLQARYPGSYAQGLLARKASLPLLSLSGPSSASEGSVNDDGRAGSPSAGGGHHQHRRFAAPTASSLARKRERPSPAGERGSIINPNVYTPPPPTTMTPPGPRSATPQLTFSPSPAHAGALTAAGSRLTMPTSSTRLKTRAPILHGAFGSTSSTSSSTHSLSPAPIGLLRPLARLQIHRTVPRTARRYGDGTELDALEDLSVDAEKERLYRVPTKKTSGTRLSDLKSGQPIAGASTSSAIAPRARVNSTLTAGTASSELKRKHGLSVAEGNGGTQRGIRKRPLPTLKVIRNLGGADQPRVEGKMRYNPATFRWEGNEAVLQAFEPTPAPVRPALITHLTGSTISSLAGTSRQPGSPVAIPGPAIGARVVGHMQFDPERMCWISLLGKNEEEPDPFADMDDDADDDESAVMVRPVRSRRDPSCPGLYDDDLEPGDALPPVDLADFIRRGPAEYDLARRSRLAEEGHRAEVAQWALGTARSAGDHHLWDIRKVALRAGKEDRVTQPTAVSCNVSSRSN